MEKAFNDVIIVVLDKNYVDTMKAKSYKFFNGTLDNMLLPAAIHIWK